MQKVVGTVPEALFSYLLSFKIFNENLVAVHEIKETLTLNRPAYVGMCILDLSKTLIYDFHYNSSSSQVRSSIIRAFLGLLLELRVMQQKLESGSDDSGCVHRTCVDTKLDFNFLDNLSFSPSLNETFSHSTKFFLTQQNPFSHSSNFFLSHNLNFFLTQLKVFLTQLKIFLTTLKFFSHTTKFFSHTQLIVFLSQLKFFCQF